MSRKNRVALVLAGGVLLSALPGVAERHGSDACNVQCPDALSGVCAQGGGACSCACASREAIDAAIQGFVDLGYSVIPGTSSPSPSRRWMEQREQSAEAETAMVGADTAVGSAEGASVEGIQESLEEAAPTAVSVSSEQMALEEDDPPGIE